MVVMTFGLCHLIKFVLMAKVLVLVDQPRIPYGFDFDVIYSTPEIFKTLSLGKNHCCRTISQDIFDLNAYRMADHIASVEVEKLVASSPKYMKLRNKLHIEKDDVSGIFVKSVLLSKMIATVRAYSYCHHVVKNREHYNDSVYFYSRKLSRVMHKEAANTLALVFGKKYKVFRGWESSLDNFLRLGYVSLYSILFPLSALIDVLSQKRINKAYTKAIVHLLPGVGFGKVQSVDFAFGEDLFRQDEIIYLYDDAADNDWFISKRRKIKKVKSFAAALITPADYLSSYFLRNYIAAFRVIYLSTIFPHISVSLLRRFVNEYNWTLIGRRSRAKHYLRFMTKADTTITSVLSNYKIKTHFVYFSSTPQIVNEKMADQIPDCEDYAYMRFNSLYATPVSIRWMKNSMSQIDEYVTCEALSVETITNLRCGIADIRHKFGFALDSKLVACFDSTVGYGGVYNYAEYVDFLSGLYALSQQSSSDVKFVFKPKKTIDRIKQLSPYISEILRKIRASNRWVVVEEHTFTSLELIAASSLVISSPLSSILYEALCSRVPVVCYDPAEKYNQAHRPINSNTAAYFTNYEDLLNLVDNCPHANKINSNLIQKICTELKMREAVQMRLCIKCEV